MSQGLRACHYQCFLFAFIIIYRLVGRLRSTVRGLVRLPIHYKHVDFLGTSSVVVLTSRQCNKLLFTLTISVQQAQDQEQYKYKQSEWWIVKGERMFYIAHVPSPLDHSNRFTLHPLADMLIPITTRLLWEAFSHAAMTAPRLRSHHSTTDSLWPGQVLIYTAV